MFARVERLNIFGSAPDIAGKGVANPVGAILSFALCLQHSLGKPQEARRLEEAVEAAIARRRADQTLLLRERRRSPLTPWPMRSLQNSTEEFEGRSVAARLVAAYGSARYVH